MFPNSVVSMGPVERLTFHSDSRAIHIVASLNEEDFADRWYLWNGSSLKLIRKTPAQELPDSANAP
jgi:hypothetical protein